MTNYSRTTLRELKKRYLNILKKCLLANLMAFMISFPSMAETASEDWLTNSGEKTYTQGVTFKDLKHVVSVGDSHGGAIYNSGTITFGGLATFEGNKSSATGGHSYGGAIWNYGTNAVLTFNNEAQFKNNTATDKADGSPVGGNASGGAIYNSGTITFGGLATFEGNSATVTDGSSWGGAIVNSAGSVVFKDTDNNEETPAVPNITYGMTFKSDTLFTGNKAESETGDSYGGAISNGGYMLLAGENTFGGYLQDTEDADEDGDKTEYVLDSKGNKISLGNESKVGGAIYNIVGKKEGDVIAYGMTLGKSTFMGNTALTHGGAIFNSGYMNFTDDALFEGNNVESENSEARGGGIYNSGTITFGALATFEGNTSSATGGYSFGGAIRNEGANAVLTFNGDTLFTGNKAESETFNAEGGAIRSNAGSVVFEDTDNNAETPAVPNITYGMTFKGDTTFTGNKAESETGNSYGGAIWNSSYMLLEGKNTFDSNQAKDGGAIYNAGGKKEGDVIAYGMTLGKSTFMGNTALFHGGAIYNSRYMNFMDEALFEGNTVDKGVNSDAYGGAIANYKNITFKEKVIFKNNEAKAVVRAVGGAIFHYGGTITFEKGFEFVGNKIINDGKVSNNDIIMYNDAVLNLGTENSTSTADELMAEGGITSNHTTPVINKYSQGNFILRTENSSSNNMGFAGIFNQYAGTTIADSDKFFNGTNTITGGELRVHGANMSNLKVTVGENALLTFLSTSTSEIEMKLGENVSVAGDVKFGADESIGTAKYHLKDDVTAKIITIQDSILTTGNKEFKGIYVMGENVTLDMQDGKVTDRVKFTKLTGSANLKIDANIVNGENGLELVTDKIATNQEATLKLAFTDVVLSEKALDNGLSESYTATVMTGGTLTYGSEKGLVATDVYQYEVSGANNQITIDAVKFNEGSDVMKSVAEFDGDAAFNMTIGGDSYEMKSDVVMTKNTKSIVGKDKETSTLTAKKITVNGATLNVENVSVSGENQLIDVASGTLNVTTAKVDNIKNAGTTMLNTAEVSELENTGTLTANGSEIGEFVNGNKAEVTGGELETATNKEKGMLSLSAGLRAGTVTNEGELTLDAVTVADLTNSATLKANGSTLTKLVNEQEAELTASTVEDLTNTGKMTAKDLTLKGALKGTGTATLSGKLVADDIFKSENKIISDGMEVSENIQKMELADLEIKEGTTLDIGTREVTAKDVKVGDKATLQVTLNDLDEHGTMKADKIEAGVGAGVHLVLGEKFEGGMFDVFQGTKGAGDLEVKHNNLYNVIEVEEGKYSFMTKDTEALQESLGATKEEVTIADAMTKGTSTNAAFNKMQSEMLIALQSLESETVAKAKKALSAVGAKEHPIEQSVASEHLVALQNVVQAELHGTTVGHSGGDTDPRAKVYIKGLYDRTKSSMGEGFRARSKGAVLGVQSEVTEGLTLGVGYATSQTTAKEDLRRTEVDTNTGFISAHYQPNAWWVSGLATFSRGEYEEEKQVLSSTGKATYDVDSWGAQVMTGYDIKLENAIITPEVGLRYLSVKQEGYTDTLGTTVSGTRSDYLTALVGVKGTWDMGAIRPTAGVTVGYDVISDDVSALNTLANGASYTVNGEALDRLSTTVTTGIEADLGERTTLKLEYSGTYRKEYQDHSGMLRLEWRF